MICGPAIFLGFDDHFIHQWYGVRDLLVEYGAKVTFYLAKMDEYTDQEWTMLNALREDGHTIGHHGLRHRRAGEVSMSPNDERRKDPEVITDWSIWLEKEIHKGSCILHRHGIPIPKHYSYPNGNRSPESDEVLLRVFKTLRVGGTRYWRPSEIGKPHARIVPGLNFGKNSKSRYCGHEGVVHHVADKGLVTSLYMHRPVQHRLVWLLQECLKQKVAVLGMEDWSV